MQAASPSGFDAREALRRATECVKRGELEPAIVQLKELLAADPRHEIAAGMLAGIYAELKMPERAVELYRRVLSINPDNALARLHLGLLHLTNGRPQEAVDTLRRSLEDENDFLAHFHSALALLELRRPAEARLLLERVAERMPASHILYPQVQKLLAQPTS